MCLRFDYNINSSKFSNSIYTHNYFELRIYWMEVLSKKLYLIETGYFKPSVGSIYIIDRNKDKEL